MILSRPWCHDTHTAGKESDSGMLLSRSLKSYCRRRSLVKVKLYNTQQWPYAMRTRMVLHEKGIDFEVHEVDLSDKSEEFLKVSPYGKVAVLRVDGTSLYESNIVNEYLDEVYDSPKLMPGDPEERALVRSWMAFADDYFFPSVYRVGMGLQRGYSEEEIQEAREKLDDALSRLEHQLEGREYLVGEYTLGDIAHAGNFHRLRVLANSGEVSLEKYPGVMVWIERVQSRESYEASV